MTQKAKRRIQQGPPGDLLGLRKHVRDGSISKVLDDSLYRFRIGLFAINGVNDFDAAEAADFFIQAFLGLNIVALCCEDQEGRNQMAELEAVTPASMMRKARQMVKNLEQLELDLSPSNFDDCPW